jgi:hypothetical protein
VSEAREPIADDEIGTVVEQALATTPFPGIHTHLFASAFGGLGLWGIRFVSSSASRIPKSTSRAYSPLRNTRRRAPRCDSLVSRQL